MQLGVEGFGNVVTNKIVFDKNGEMVYGERLSVLVGLAFLDEDQVNLVLFTNPP